MTLSPVVGGCWTCGACNRARKSTFRETFDYANIPCRYVERHVVYSKVQKLAPSSTLMCPTDTCSAILCTRRFCAVRVLRIRSFAIWSFLGTSMRRNWFAMLSFLHGEGLLYGTLCTGIVCWLEVGRGARTVFCGNFLFLQIICHVLKANTLIINEIGFESVAGLTYKVTSATHWNVNYLIVSRIDLWNVAGELLQVNCFRWIASGELLQVNYFRWIASGELPQLKSFRWITSTEKLQLKSLSWKASAEIDYWKHVLRCSWLDELRTRGFCVLSFK